MTVGVLWRSIWIIGSASLWFLGCSAAIAIGIGIGIGWSARASASGCRASFALLSLSIHIHIHIRIAIGVFIGSDITSRSSNHSGAAFNIVNGIHNHGHGRLHRTCIRLYTYRKRLNVIMSRLTLDANGRPSQW